MNPIDPQISKIRHVLRLLVISATPVSILVLVLGLFWAAPIAAQPITITYFERPPYYMNKNGKPAGLLIELTINIFKDAGIPFTFDMMPPKRILQTIRDEKHQCSVGWFKNPQRERFVKFSIPIYHDKAIILLTDKHHKDLFKGHHSLSDVFNDPNLIMGTMSGFSYGQYIDDLKRRLDPKIMEISGQQRQLPNLIKGGRIHYILIAPEETGMLIQSAGCQADDFITISLPDIPEGNTRYLIFSKDIPDTVIQKINQSIAKFVP